MTTKEDNESRRSFLKTGASAAGGLVLGASLGCTQETQVQVIEINALLPTPEQMQTFLMALVEYPTPTALFEMVNSDEYQAIHHHREAGLEGQVLYAVLQNPGAEK